MIPTELAERPQWVLWRFEERDGKRTKVPYNPNQPQRRASSTDPATWGTLVVAAGAAIGNAEGIGFVFSDDDPFAGVDLDNCIIDGELHPAVAKIVGMLDSYAETSPSGNGVHVIVRANVNGGPNRTGKTPWGSQFENYGTGRFFCFTGTHITGTPETINERQEQLDAIRGELFPPPPKREPHREPVPPSTLDDRELLDRARAAKNGATFESLWRGDTSGHGGDASAADLALCGLLAFWTGPDAARIDALFRQSALMRDKWDERRGDSTYGAQTIDKAISGRTEFYGDRPRSNHRAADQSAAGDDRYAVTWSKDKTPKLLMPSDPAHDDIAGLLAWISSVARFDKRHPATSVLRHGHAGPNGHIEITRADAASVMFEPASVINTARRFKSALSWYLLPTDGRPFGFKDEHCAQIAHILLMAAGAGGGLTAADEAAGIIGTYLQGAEAVEGYTTYGTPQQRHEAVAALRPADPAGRAWKYLLDLNTGEVAIRVSDLQDAARRHTGSSQPHGWLDGRIEQLGWTRVAIRGYAQPGREGRKGPTSRCDVYRGFLPSDPAETESVRT